MLLLKRVMQCLCIIMFFLSINSYATSCTVSSVGCSMPSSCTSGLDSSDITYNGPISSTLAKYYFEGDQGSRRITIFDQNDLKTSAVYIQCTGSYEDCIAGKPGSYKQTENINEATGKQPAKGDGTCCPLTLCDIPDGVIKGYIRYGQVTDNYKSYFTLTPDNTKADVGVSNSVLKIRSVMMQGKVCAAALLPAGYYYFGCKNYTKSDTQAADNPACPINSACSVTGQNHSLFFLSVTGRMVECVKGAIEVIFNGVKNPCPDSQSFSMLKSLQDNLRPAVMAALILYTIIFGINLALSERLVQKGQVFGFLIKMILVLYFSVGIKMDDGSYKNGINQYVFNGFYSVMSSMSNFVLGSAGGKLCNFSNIMKEHNNPYYDASTGVDYSYLAVWDSLDCRLAYYTGLVSIPQVIADNTGKYSWDSFFNVISNSSLLYLFALSILTFQFVFTIMTGIFFSFILSIAVYFVKLFIMAMVALAVMSYLAVIFVPFSLFEATKPYFDAWLKNMISFSLQPVVVTAFMAILMGIFNDVIFNGCQALLSSDGTVITSSCWIDKNIKFSAWKTNFNTYWWYFDHANCSHQCKSSFGYALYNPVSPYVEEFDALFFSWKQLSESAWSTLLPGILKTVMYCFVFYFFALKLGGFAARVTNGIEINAGSPMELFDKVMQKIKEKATTKPTAGPDSRKDSPDKEKGISDMKARGSGPEGSKGKDVAPGGPGGKAGGS